ncbi:hypothetical protein Ddc_17981 [Ditylenchus destructor]|nr:hypothetical protein Ddc_17981 [Ditylenchus destructor]
MRTRSGETYGRRSVSPFSTQPTLPFYDDYENIRANCDFERIATDLQNNQPTQAAAAAMRAYLAIEAAGRSIIAPLAPISISPTLPREKLKIQLPAYKSGIASQFPVVISNTGSNNEMVKLACSASSPLSADRTYCILGPHQTEIFFFGLHTGGYDPETADKWDYRVHIMRKRIKRNDAVLADYNGQTTRTGKAAIVRTYWNDHVTAADGHAYLNVQIWSPPGDPPARALTWPDTKIKRPLITGPRKRKSSSSDDSEPPRKISSPYALRTPAVKAPHPCLSQKSTVSTISRTKERKEREARHRLRDYLRHRLLAQSSRHRFGRGPFRMRPWLQSE